MGKVRTPAGIPRSLILLFVVITIALTLANAYGIYREMHPEWKLYQDQFRASEERKTYERLGRLVQSETPIEIRQIFLPQLNRIDRCTSCHLGVEDPRFSDATSPFKTHPDFQQHPFEKFGCTVCHGGQGRATTVKDAHGKVLHWEEPMLPPYLIQSSCGKCHLDQTVSEAPLLTSGRRLIERYGCLGCHKIEGQSPNQPIGPDLVGIGSKVRRDWLVHWLRNPKAYLLGTRMPNFELKEDEIEALVAYLMDSTDEGIAGRAHLIEQETALPKGIDLYEVGRVRFGESRCITCHTVSGKGGSIGPELTHVASKVRKEWLVAWLKNPKAYLSRTRMPQFSFPNEDILAITTYMMEEFVDPEAADKRDDLEQLKIPAELKERGKRVALKYGCYACHVLPGNLKGPDVGPELTSIGSKSKAELEFGTLQGVEKSLPNWLFLKLKHPRIYGEDLKMPFYDLSDEDALAITNALLSLTKEKIPLEYVRKTPEKGFLRIEGEVGQLVKKYECLTCHTIQGRGGYLAPDLSVAGSKLNPDWVEGYLKLPYTIRPLLTERMPILKISDGEAKLLSRYIQLTLVSDEIPKGKDLPPLSDEQVAWGKTLYAEKGCRACHILGKSGGYVGPSLNGVGSRLTRGWVFQWLKDPQHLVPEAVEPNYGFTDEEAWALTAYLSTLQEEKKEETSIATAP